MGIGYIKLVVSHAAAAHRFATVRVQINPIDVARIALKRLGVVGQRPTGSLERDLQPARRRSAGLASTL
jgi:hypothetical protein